MPERQSVSVLLDNVDKLLQAIAALRIVVVGDAILDHYVIGDAERISPEAPVPVVDVEQDVQIAGGAANVALNLRALGATVELAGAVGCDRHGDSLLDLLSSAGVTVRPAFRIRSVQTIVKTRVMVRGQQLCRIDRESVPECYRLPPQSICELAAAVAGADAVIISDYAKGVVCDQLLSEMRARRDEIGFFLAMDPKPKHAVDVRGLDLLTPNRPEALMLAGLTAVKNAPFPAGKVCAAIAERWQPRNLVVTLGGDGMLLSCGNGVNERIPAIAREVFDVSGAGDTVVAVLTAALAAGASLSAAARIATAAAGVVVSKSGTAVASVSEIRREIETAFRIDEPESLSSRKE